MKRNLREKGNKGLKEIKKAINTLQQGGGEEVGVTAYLNHSNEIGDKEIDKL